MEGLSRFSLRCRVWPGFVCGTSTTFLSAALWCLLPGAHPALAAPIAGTPATGSTYSKDRAANYLEKGVDSYRRGLFQQSAFYLRAARKLDPGQLSRSATALRLEAFLLFSEDRRGPAAALLAKSVALQPDPFLYYLLGSYNLGLRSLRQARNAYRSAVLTHGRLYERGPGEAEGYPIGRFLPFACPTAPEQARFFGSQRVNPFASGAEAAALWDRVLHPAEVALAAYQWLTLSRHLNRTGTPEINAARAALDKHRSGLATLDATSGAESATAAVARAPESREALNRCLRELAGTEMQLQGRLARGNTAPTQELLQSVHEMQRRVYRNALGNFGGLQDYYMYGTHALRHGNLVEALHSLRRALSLAQLRPGPGGIEGDLRQAASVYRALELVYRKFNRDKDADTVADLARRIERFLTQPPGPEDSARRQDLQRQLLRTGRLFLYNREALSLLIAHARATGNERTLRYYRERMKSRDRKYEYTEMLAAYPEL